MTTVGNTVSAEQLAPVGVADAITQASDTFFPLNCDGHFSYLVSNDSHAGIAYAEAALRRPEVVGQQAVTLLVGHASFETATLLIPESDVILFCDRDPWNLFMQKMHIELIKQNPDLASFRAAEDVFIDQFGRLFSEYKGDGYMISPRTVKTDYFERRAQSWNDGNDPGGNEIPHFLSSEEQYRAVRERIENGNFAFYVAHLGDEDEVKKLGGVLAQYNCVIAEANLTNVLNRRYTGSNPLQIFENLPWHPDAVCIDSHFGEGFLRSGVYSKDELTDEIERREQS